MFEKIIESLFKPLYFKSAPQLSFAGRLGVQDYRAVYGDLSLTFFLLLAYLGAAVLLWKGLNFIGALFVANLFAYGFGALFICWVIYVGLAGARYTFMRWHDFNRSGWTLFLVYVGIAILDNLIAHVIKINIAFTALAFTLFLFIKEVKPEPNAYGEPTDITFETEASKARHVQIGWFFLGCSVIFTVLGPWLTPFIQAFIYALFSVGS